MLRRKIRFRYYSLGGMELEQPIIYPSCLAEENLKHIPENLIILNCEIKSTRTGKELVNFGFFGYYECLHLLVMRSVDGEYQDKALKDIKLPTASIPY